MNVSHDTCRGSCSLLFRLVELHVCLFCWFCGRGGCRGCPGHDTCLQILFKKICRKNIHTLSLWPWKKTRDHVQLQLGSPGFAFNRRTIKQDEWFLTQFHLVLPRDGIKVRQPWWKLVAEEEWQKRFVLLYIRVWCYLVLEMGSKASCNGEGLCVFCSLSHEQVAAGAQRTLEFPSSWMEQSLAAVGFQTVESSGHGSSGASVGHSGPSLSPPTPF